MADFSREAEPCCHCGIRTRQRAEGIPYCSMECIRARRREQRQESLECPCPDCDWQTNYDPVNAFQRALAYKEAEDHRDDHREALEVTAGE